MTATIEHAQQRIVVAKTMLDIARLFSSSYFQDERFGSRADDLLLYAALFIGHAESKPMNASKLAEYAGLARPTVIRKLNAMEKRGSVKRIGDGFGLALSLVNSAAALRASEAARKRILSCAAAIDGVANRQTSGTAAPQTLS